MIALRRTDLVYHIQRHVGYAGAIACLAIGIFNVIAGLIQDDGSLLRVVTNPAVYVLFLFSGLAYVTTLRNWNAFRIIQVSVFLIYAYVASIFVDPGSLHGALWGIYGIVLSVQYGFMRSRFWLKIIVLAVTYASTRVIRAVDENTFIFHAAPAIAILVAMFAYLFWVVFAEEIRTYTSENRYLKDEREDNRIFVEFGKNISGVVHNLKSTLMSIDGCIDVLRDAEGPDREELLDIQKSSSEKMLNMINNFMTAVRSYQRDETSVFSLNSLVESSIEVLKGNRKLKHRLKIEMNLEEPDSILGVPMEIMQVIDNVVTNAAEAMMDTRRYTLLIETKRVDDCVRLSIADEGVGIERCERCDELDCMRCNLFAYGKTTKPDGAGIGMVYVCQILEGMGGRMKIESEKDRGTTIHLYFPLQTETITETPNEIGNAV